MIFTKTHYETHNQELLAIVKTFKTWRDYLKGYKYEIPDLTEDNNICRFIDTKSGSSHQVYLAKKLS